MIIDSHCHVGKGDGLTGPWDTAADLGDYWRRADQAGIDRTVLFSLFHSDYAATNRAVARIVDSNRERLFGFACIHPVRDKGRVFAMLGEAVNSFGFCGVKVHHHDGLITREICDALRVFALPVIYDVMGEVAQVELLATEYPDVSFIIPHLGSFSDDWRAQRGLIDLLVRHNNVFTDTSGVRRFDLLLEAVRRAGAKKVLFGSDGPWLHPGVELAKVFALELSQVDQQLILGGNLLRLISGVRKVTLPRRNIASGSMVVPHQNGFADPWAGEQFP